MLCFVAEGNDSVLARLEKNHFSFFLLTNETVLFSLLSLETSKSLLEIIIVSQVLSKQFLCEIL